MNRLFYWLFFLGLGTIVFIVLAMISWLTPSPTSQTASPAEQAVQRDLSLKTGINVAEIKITSSVGKDWPNSCLGVNNPELFCAQVIVPGYEIKATANGVDYKYHTNKDGSVVVLIN